MQTEEKIYNHGIYKRVLVYEWNYHLYQIVCNVQIWYSYARSVWAVKVLEFIPDQKDIPVNWQYITMNHSYQLPEGDFPVTIFGPEGMPIHYITYTLQNGSTDTRLVPGEQHP